MHGQENRQGFGKAPGGRGVIALALVCGFVPGAEAIARDQIKIALVDAKGATVKESAGGTLQLSRKYVKGDRIVVTGAEYLAVKVDRHYAEAILFAPGKRVDFPIPLWPRGKYPKRYPHPPKAFQGERHVITARVATPKQIGSYRNVACNPMDPRGKSVTYPHAGSNSEWGDAAVFAARNAIDGFVEATGDHHSWPRQSWGPYLPGPRHPKPELAIEFGRPVEIDKLVVVVRHNVRQNNHWQAATVAFSDGTKVRITPQFNGKRQEFPIAKRVVTGMKITSLVPAKPGKYAAFVEVEAWGKPPAKRPPRPPRRAKRPVSPTPRDTAEPATRTIRIEKP